MSEIVPVQTPPAAPAADGNNMDARLQRAMAHLASKAPAPAPETEPAAPEPAPAAKADTAPDASAAPADKAAPAAPPADKRLTDPAAPEPAAAAAKPEDQDLRFARMQRATQQKEREAYEAKQAAKALEKQLADVRAELDKRRAEAEAEAKRRASMTPLELLEHEKKTTYEQLTKDIVDKKYEPKSPEQLAIMELRQALEAARADQERDRAEREAERKAAAEERERLAKEQQAASVADQLQQELRANSAHFPVLATMPWAGKEIVRYAERTGKTYAEAAQELERGARSDVNTVFGSEDTLKVFLGDDAIKSRILTLLGIKQTDTASPASHEGTGSPRKGAPAAIPQSRSADSGTRVKTIKPVTTEDRIQAGLRHLEARIRSR